MTDLQVRYQANQIAEEQNKIRQAELDEKIRANQMNEILTDLENLGKYGYVAYQPGTAKGYYAKSNSQGTLNIAPDLIEKMLGWLGNSVLRFLK